MIASSAGAAAKKKDKDGIPYWQAIDRYLKPVTLTDEQKSKLEDLKKEYAPKLKEAYAKEDVLTPEQKKAGQDAQKAAKAAGKKGQDLKAAVADAVKKTDDQQKKEDEARKARTAVQNDMHKRIVALLTPEQRAQIAAARSKKPAKPATPEKPAESTAPATPAPAK
jgi:Spy/CpxP family protein refolding chaperone